MRRIRRFCGNPEYLRLSRWQSHRGSSIPKESGPEALAQDNWITGFLQIQNQIKDFLKKEGIEEIETVGKKFDPNFMEAVGEVEAAFAEASAGQRAESETVAEELQKGYKIEDRILRPAKVKISK